LLSARPRLVAIDDLDRTLASSFALGWETAFEAIDDHSETLVAGMASWILATPYENETERVYYMVTRNGLHVGQEGESPGFLRSAPKLDHFIARDSIVDVETDYRSALQVDSRDASRVIIWFSDVFEQLRDHYVGHWPARDQAMTVAAALGWPVGVS